MTKTTSSSRLSVVLFSCILACNYVHESPYINGEYAPLYPFGFGLSYIDFKYENLKLSTKKIVVGEPITVSVDVTNTGERDGEEVVGQNYLENYKGKPWNNQPQQIPGKIQCELYDLGGQNIAYFDKDSINNGSGKLNPADGTFLNEFRLKEGVDISYTKARDIDNSPYNVVEPLIGELYVGWTMPGEWINYTVKVSETGTYSVNIMYTASGDGGIAFLLDGKAISSEILIPSTRNDNETIAWRQWHHWNKINGLGTVKLKKGTHVLTLKTITNGNMNYDYLEFNLINLSKKN